GVHEVSQLVDVEQGEGPDGIVQGGAGEQRVPEDEQRRQGGQAGDEGDGQPPGHAAQGGVGGQALDVALAPADGVVLDGGALDGVPGVALRAEALQLADVDRPESPGGQGAAGQGDAPPQQRRDQQSPAGLGEVVGAPRPPGGGDGVQGVEVAQGPADQV